MTLTMTMTGSGCRRRRRPTPTQRPPLLPLLLASMSRISPVVAAEELLTGDLDLWDSVFASRSPRTLVDGPANGLVWTEGPVVVGHELLFSDTVGDATYAVDVAAAVEGGRGVAGGRLLWAVKERSGESPADERRWRAEPGGNGMAALPGSLAGGGGDGGAPERPPGREVLLCQHGARRLVVADVDTGETRAEVAGAYGGRRLNGPNDVVVRAGDDDGGGGGARAHAYFTDPVYAWLERGRFEDLPYLDERVRAEGPGHCGVYRVELVPDVTGNRSVRGGRIDLVTSDMVRPNGIGFVGDDLVVSDCCQGSHLERCRSGTSRWEVLRRRAGGEDAGWDHVRTVEDTAPLDGVEGGCADGFAVHAVITEKESRDVLLASCFGGLCIVDMESGTVAARLWTAREEGGGCRISNVAVWTGGHVFLTGSCGVLSLPLKKVHAKNDNESRDQEGEPLAAEL